MTLCAALWDLANKNPTMVVREATGLFQWLSAQDQTAFFFDERDYFLGESALLVAGSGRLLGKREETERWLDRADANFRHTVAPASHLARASYVRLALRYDMKRHEEVLEFAPSVALTFRKLGMEKDLAKCMFLEAMSLKQLGKIELAVARFERLILAGDFNVEASIRGMALVNLGDLHSDQGSHQAALEAYQRAMPLLQSSNQAVALADLKLMVSGALRRAGLLVQAIEGYQDAIKDYVQLGMSTYTAYVRVLFAEVLISAGKAREAEWQILAALPTINDEKMVPEGFAAVSLLQESARQRKTDSRALSELREYLQAKS